MAAGQVKLCFNMFYILNIVIDHVTKLMNYLQVVVFLKLKLKLKFDMTPKANKSNELDKR